MFVFIHILPASVLRNCLFVSHQLEIKFISFHISQNKTLSSKVAIAVGSFFLKVGMVGTLFLLSGAEVFVHRERQISKRTY